MRQRLFFGLYLNLGVKFRTEIELLSLTKVLENISPPQNLLNPERIDAYEYWNMSTMPISTMPMSTGINSEMLFCIH